MDHEQLKLVHLALLEKGYDPLGQLVGYLLAENLTYITNHNNARGTRPNRKTGLGRAFVRYRTMPETVRILQEYRYLSLPGAHTKVKYLFSLYI